LDEREINSTNETLIINQEIDNVNNVNKILKSRTNLRTRNQNIKYTINEKNLSNDSNDDSISLRNIENECLIKPECNSYRYSLLKSGH